MIRVLHIVSKLSINSGVMNMIMNYYRYIDRSKIQFDFLYFEERTPDFKREIENLGGKFYFVNKPSIKKLLGTYRKFNAFFQKNYDNYSVVHLHEMYLVHFIGYFCKKYRIQRLITHAHTTKYSDNPKNAFRNKLMCVGLKSSATDYFACSKAAGRVYYGAEMVNNGNVKIIPNAINIEKYKFDKNVRNELRKKLNIEKNFVIGHVGRMAIPKNQKFLLKIFREVLNKRKDAILLIIGDGPLRNELERIIEQLDIKNNVLLLGSREDVYKYYSVMDVFVLPSLYEGLGNVLIEAQANGLSCIVSSFVPIEANLGNCRFLSLNEDKSVWVNLLLNSSRYSLYREDRNINYDIKYCVKILEDYYLDIDRR